MPGPSPIPAQKAQKGGKAGVVEPGMRVNYAIVFVSDMKQAVSFYRDVMGLPLKFESPGWTEFATEGATLALHGGEGGGRSRPGWSVPNLDEYHKNLMDRGVICVQPPTATFGVRIAIYKDPDGLEISVSEQK